MIKPRLPLEDGRKIPVRCSNCNTSLCEVWVTRPNFPAKNVLVANCGKCGDKSFKIEFDGGFHIGEGEIPYTDIKTEEKDGVNYIIIET